MPLRKHIATLLALLCTALSFGQSQAVWSGAVHRGFLIPHRSNVLHLVQGHTLGAELNVEWLAKEKAAWSLVYSDPTVGIDAYFTSTGNREQLGHQFAVHGFARLPLGDTYVTQTLKLGVGLGYATRTWDLQENVRAPMVGSHLNAALVLQYNACVHIRGWALRTGLRLEHFSNGAFQLPNLGTNIASVSLGFGPRIPVHMRPMLTVTDLPYDLTDRFETRRYGQWTASLSAGIKEVGDPLGPKYGVFILSTMYQRRWSYKSSWAAGTDVFYNRSMPAALNDSEAGIGKQLLLGLYGAYLLHFNAFELQLGMGAYMVDPYKGYGTFYHRFGLKYWATERLFAQFMLKTHFARADHGELGMGMLIGNRQNLKQR